MARRGMCSTICLNEKLHRFRISDKADNFNSRSGSFFERSISLVLLLWCFLFLVYSKLGQSHNYQGQDRIGNYTDGSVSKILNSTSSRDSVSPQATGKENNYCLLRNGQLQDVYEHVLGNNALLICIKSSESEKSSKKRKREFVIHLKSLLQVVKSN